MVRPVSPEMVVDVLRDSAANAQAVLVHGGQTKLGWLRDAGNDVDVTVDMTGLSGIVAHDHGDMTATVYAGTPMATVQAALAERGQRLAIDPPLGADRQATIGGVYASDDAGPARLAYGTLRELCIGARYVLADGTSAKTGSKVIKNVAGFDLGKLLCGSRGTLAVVTELTVRLHPIPATESTVRAQLSLPDAARVAARLNDLVADGVTYHGADLQSGELWVRATGPRGLVKAQTDFVRKELLGSDANGVEVVDDAVSQEAWREATETRRGRDGESVVAISVPPRREQALASALVSTLRELSDLRCRTVADPLLGFVLIMLSAPDGDPVGPPRIAQAVGVLRTVAQHHGGHARLRSRVAGVTDHVDPFGPLPSSLPIMQRIKAALDPEGRLAPDRYLTQP